MSLMPGNCFADALLLDSARAAAQRAAMLARRSRSAPHSRFSVASDHVRPSAKYSWSPNMVTGIGIDQLRSDPNALVAQSDATLDDVTRAEISRDFANIG